MKETKFGEDFTDELIKGKPAWKLKVSGHERQRRGIPDWLLCINGLFFGIEFKIQRYGSIKIEPLQIGQINNIRRSGGRCYLIAYEEKTGLTLVQHKKKLTQTFKIYRNIKWEKEFINIRDACEFLMEGVE